MKQVIPLIMTVLTLTACSQGQMKTSEGAMDQFEAFTGKEKFAEDVKAFYPGIGNPVMKPILTDKINKAAEDFKEVAQRENPTAKKYQEQIDIGLRRFSDAYSELDTEDRERVCTYFEELMDLVGLESSDGKLNEFMYGFDPKEKT